MTIPNILTMEQLSAYADWHVQNGRGKDTAALDRRSLDYLLEKHLPTKGLTIPPEGEQSGGGRVYLRLVF